LAADDLAATLAGIREHNERVIALCGMAPAVVRQLAEHDVPRLLAAIDAVLELHQPVDYVTGAQCKGCATHVTFAWWPCPTVLAITGEVTGQEAGSDE